MSSLQKYLDYLRKEREAKEALLKSMGMNFAGLDNLKDEAIAEMQSLGQDKVELDKYVATLESHPIRIAPDKGVEIGKSYRISLHTKR